MRSVFRQLALFLVVGAVLAGCGQIGQSTANRSPGTATDPNNPNDFESGQERAQASGTTIRDAFLQRRNEERIVQVNRYIWTASLQVLNFLPIQEVDPYTGVIITGFGTPPGGGNSYRATVLIQDPALDARSLNVALQTRGGPASASTVRAVEDAILTRARQLRIADGGR
ncbi:MAG: DUF3576 domain-containing protein [Pseudomonadota bacterium]